MAPGVDRITAEVIAHRLAAASDEMMATLVKTAYSPNIKERRDCSVAIFDAAGSLLALTAIAPIHLSSLLGLVRNITQQHALTSFKPGDAFLTNDPYVGGGSHLPDLTLASPVFVDGRVVAFVANIAHHSDVGGKVAGSESADCTSIFQEGLRVPPVRLLDGGNLCGDVLQFVLLNSRTPRERDGDIRAQIATNATGVRRVEETFARFGTEAVLAGIEQLLAYSEARARAEIAKLPDGVYENEDCIDNDGVEDRLVRLKVTVTIEGDNIRFDFAGSDPQIAGARNMPLSATQSGVYYAVKAVTDPGLPPNSGYFRAIEVNAPEGSVLNCRAPAAVGDRSATGNIFGDLLLGALAKAAPDRVMAGCGPLRGLIFSGVDPRTRDYFVDYETYAGASGALAEQDGKDAVRVHVSGSANLPVESVEQEFPLTVGRYELVADTGGPGRFRGGLATRRDVTIWAESARLAGRGLRETTQAQGLFGGGAGKSGRFVLDPDGNREERLPGAFSELAIEPGSTVRVETPSGAGFGDPLERPPGRVLADVIAGKVSADEAESTYGVAVVDGAVDEARTAGLRRRGDDRSHVVAEPLSAGWAASVQGPCAHRARADGATPVDRITTEVIAHRLAAASDEMMATLVKTAYSPNIKERRDCSVAIFDSQGNLVALTAIAPMHLSSMLGLVENVTQRHSQSSLRPGDVILTNDPYVGGGSHLPDLTLVSPVFVDDRLVAYVANIAHHSDVGGKVAGSESADCTSIFQEGLRIPPVKLLAGGVLCQDVMNFVLLNSRTPREREGDIRAQLATNATGIRRVTETIARFGRDEVAAAITAWLDYTEARTRAEIAKLPDGVYECEDILDNDGVQDRRVRLKVAITIEGDDIRFDFSGSDPQIAGARNMPWVGTLSSVYYAVKAVTDPSLPPNAGYFRAIEVTAPEGSVLNCRPPAAVGDRGATGNVLGDVLLGALARAAPDRVMAACGPLHGLIFSGIDPRRGAYFVDYETYAGASGALLDQDGKDAVRVHVSGAANLPVEALEQEFALTVGCYELVPDTGGPGRQRGGLSTRRDVTIWAEEARLAGRGLRQKQGAPGLFGGGPGRTGRFLLQPGAAGERCLPSSFSELAIRPGTTVRVETPSGAGYGEPLARDANRVLADVIAGKVSAEGAASGYGVALDDGKLDPNGTASLRAHLHGKRSGHGG